MAEKLYAVFNENCEHFSNHGNTRYNRNHSLDVPFAEENFTLVKQAPNEATGSVLDTVEWIYIEVKIRWTQPQMSSETYEPEKLLFDFFTWLRCSLRIYWHVSIVKTSLTVIPG